MLNKFGNLFITNEEKERLELHLYTLKDSLFKNYDTITFNTSRTELNSKEYYGFFISKASETDITSLLPNQTFDTFEINAWISEDGKYYSLEDLKTMKGNHTLSAYISTKQNYFEFETISGGATISNYTGTSEVVIFPEYALLGGKYVKVIGMKELVDESKTKYSAFTGNTTISTLVLNESLIAIGGNAFKNCLSLKHIYISNSVESIASDAFYFTEGNDWGKNGYASALRIHFLYQTEAWSSKFSGKTLLAFNDSRKYYYSTKELFSDLRSTFVDELNTVSGIVNSILQNI